ncbi:MAG: ABC-type transport auxiliary lipoprotein family protein [Planctomycetota bacterium]
MKSLIASVSIAALSLACGSAPEIHYYTVDATGAGREPRTERAEPLLESLNIRRVWGADFLELNNLEYEEPELKVGYYHQHRWVAQPRHLVESALVEVLRAARLARYVFSSNDLHAAPVELEVEVQQFGELDRREDEAVVPYGRVTLRLVGADHRGDHVRLFEHHASREVRSQQRTHEAVVQAINEALGQVLAELGASVRSELQREPEQKSP